MLAVVFNFLPVFGIAVSAAIILLLRDWRITFPALLVNYVSLAVFLARQQALVPSLLVESGIWTIVAVKLVTGIAVTLILTITALTFTQDYGLEELDEFGLAELRRAARSAQKHHADQPFRLGEYAVPFGALLLALLMSLTLPLINPLATARSVDFAWYWLGLTGIFTLATANDLLKIGLGLLLSISSIDLQYTAVVSMPDASGVGIIPLLLLSLLTILLALAVAYLSGLLYARLKTLDLNELYKQVQVHT